MIFFSALTFILRISNTARFFFFPPHLNFFAFNFFFLLSCFFYFNDARVTFYSKMTTSKTLIHQVLKLGLENTDAIRSFFESTSPTTQELNTADDHGDTLSHFAARAHALPLLQLLHQHQVNMTTANEHGKSRQNGYSEKRNY